MYDPNLIPSAENRHRAIAHLINTGRFVAPELHVKPNVELFNLYHETGAGSSLGAMSTELERVAADILVKTLEGLPAGRIDEELMRYLAHNEAETLITAATLPRRLEIVSPRGSVTLEATTHYRTPLVIQVAAIGHEIMMVGPAGCGKTTIGEHVAQALQLPFNITSTINDTHELIGFVDGHGRYHDTPFRAAFEHGGVWLADEIDAWDASALLAANSALANGYCNFPDNPLPVRRHADFRAIATANTYGTGADRVYVGRNELDAASLDRFAMIEVDYDIDLERMFAGDQHRWLEHVWKIRKAVQQGNIRHVVSTRAIIKGAQALAAGIAWSTVEELYLFKGMNKKDRVKVSD